MKNSEEWRNPGGYALSEKQKEAMGMVSPRVRFAKTHPNAQIPEYKTAGSAGMDLCTVERLILMPRRWHVVDCGLKMQLPHGYEAQIRPRSGLAAKHGITVLNSPGTIDSDYRGPIKVILYNASDLPHTIMCPDRIAQMVIAKCSNLGVLEVSESELTGTARGEGGFGSTGA